MFYTELQKNDSVFYGVWLVMDSVVSAEIIGYVGFDWVIIDCQHGVTVPSAIRTMAQVLSGYPHLGVFVRVPSIEAGYIQQMLDIGITGIVVPNIKTAEEVQYVVKSAKYPPDGTRSVSSTMIRATRYGLDTEYLSRANDEIVIIIQVETIEAVANIDAILNIQGITAIFPGPKDLASSMGCLDNLQHPELLNKINQIERKTKKKGILLAGGTSIEAVDQMISRGYRLITIGSDVAMLAQTVRTIIDKVKGVNSNVA